MIYDSSINSTFASLHVCHYVLMFKHTKLVMYKLSPLACLIQFLSILLSTADINECLEAVMERQVLCQMPQLCQNTLGSFSCICPPGTIVVNNTCVGMCSDVQVDVQVDAPVDSLYAYTVSVIAL